MKMSSFPAVSLVCCLGFLPICSVRAVDFAPGALISDSLTVKAGSRDAGTALNGLKSEVGNAMWVASDTLVLTANGGITISGGSGGVGSVPIPLATKPTTVQADIDAVKSGWVALAFMASTYPDSFWDSVQLLVTCLPSGDYVVYSDGVKNTIGKGVTTLVAGQKIHVELSYEPDANIITVKINGATVVDKSSLGTFKPRITAAGFRFQEPLEAQGPTVDNFAVIGDK